MFTKISSWQHTNYTSIETLTMCLKGFHELGPLGRVGLVVAMSVFNLVWFFLGLSLAPQITWSDPGLSLVQPQTSLIKSYWLTNDLLASKTVYKALYSYNKKFNTSIKYVQLDKLLGFKERFEYSLKSIPGSLKWLLELPSFI